jgi:hypothetical protein
MADVIRGESIYTVRSNMEMLGGIGNGFLSGGRQVEGQAWGTCPDGGLNNITIAPMRLAVLIGFVASTLVALCQAIGTLTIQG